MNLEELLLSDYGTIPQKIGAFLLKNNSSTFASVVEATGLLSSEVADGLSILIQKRMVKFFVFEKTFKYNINRQMIKRRLYFPIYYNYITSEYEKKYHETFKTVLLSGTYKDCGKRFASEGYKNEENINTHREDLSVIDEMLSLNIFNVEALSSKKDNPYMLHSEKQFKATDRFIIINFDYLDQKIFELETVRYVSKKYNEAAAAVLKSILKCEVVNRDNIIKNLESTKILISDNGSLINDKENINEYLRYLCNSKIVIRGFDEKRSYFLNSQRNILKSYRISLLIADPAMRRIFNMICDKNEIQDKVITIHSLLGVNRVKLALLNLQKLGLVTQKCLSDYSSGTRIEHSWCADMTGASLSMVKRLERQICRKLENINGCWDMNYFFENSLGNVNVWTSDLILMATDHLILSIDL